MVIADNDQFFSLKFNQIHHLLEFSGQFGGSDLKHNGPPS
jgi:hypothetical protein